MEEANFINNCDIEIGGSKRVLSLHVCCCPQCPSVPDLVPGWCVEKLGTHFKADRSFSFYRSLLCSGAASENVSSPWGKNLILQPFYIQKKSISNSTASVILII